MDNSEFAEHMRARRRYGESRAKFAESRARRLADGALFCELLRDGREVCVYPLLLGAGKITAGPPGDDGFDCWWEYETVAEAMDRAGHWVKLTSGSTRVTMREPGGDPVRWCGVKGGRVRRRRPIAEKRVVAMVASGCPLCTQPSAMRGWVDYETEVDDGWGLEQQCARHDRYVVDAEWVVVVADDDQMLGWRHDGESWRGPAEHPAYCPACSAGCSVTCYGTPVAWPLRLICPTHNNFAVDEHGRVLNADHPHLRGRSLPRGMAERAMRLISSKEEHGDEEKPG